MAAKHIMTYDTFKEFIDYIENNKQAERALWELHDKYPNVIENPVPLCNTGTGYITRLLDYYFNSGDLIDWWVWETDCGFNFKIGDLSYLDDTGKRIEPDLTTPEGLYAELVKSWDS